MTTKPRAAVLEALRTSERAALTSREIAKATDLDLDTVKDALSYLHRSGLVSSERLRPCKAPGQPQFEPVTYYTPALRWQDAMP